MKPTIVVSGINLFQGGTLTVYYNFCDEIIESKLYEKYHDKLPAFFVEDIYKEKYVDLEQSCD